MIRSVAGLSATSPAVANVYAALLIGPPRSKHIISPRMTPSRITEEPVMPPSHDSMAEVSEASGRPSSRNISRPIASEPMSGMRTTGMRPASQRGVFQVVIHRTR